MKGNTKKLAVFVIIATIAMFTAVAMALADDHEWNHKWKHHPPGHHGIEGEYGFAGGGNCLITPSGFSSSLVPNSAPSASSFTSQGIFTFNHNGTGRVEFTMVGLTNPPVPPPANPNGSASSSVASYPFTYKIKHDGSITIKADLNTFVQTFLTGPSGPKDPSDPNFPYHIDYDTWSYSGWVSADLKTITIAAPTTVVRTLKLKTATNVDIVTLYAICNASHTLILLDE